MNYKGWFQKKGTLIGVLTGLMILNCTAFANAALKFNGIDSYVNCGKAESLNLTETLTIEAWIYPTGWGESIIYSSDFLGWKPQHTGFGRIISKGPLELMLHQIGGNINYVSYNQRSLLLAIYNSDNSMNIFCTPDDSITLNAWQHIAVTVDISKGADGVKMYINGTAQEVKHIQEDSSIPIAIASHDDKPLIIGERSDGARAFDGLMDDIRIWNSVRTEQQIQNGMIAELTGSQSGGV
jgi:hypothetical protein